MHGWTEWKRFPAGGENIDAPIGPGLYEVRHTESGHLAAFGHTGSVAAALGKLLPARTGPWWKILHRSSPIVLDRLEYRTCATSTRAAAKSAASRLAGLRQQYWRRRMALGIATYHSLKEYNRRTPSAGLSRR